MPKIRVFYGFSMILAVLRKVLSPPILMQRSILLISHISTSLSLYIWVLNPPFFINVS